MTDQELADGLAKAVVDGDTEQAISLAKTVVDEGKDALYFLKNGLTKGMAKVTELWTGGEYFLPDVVMSANAMKAGTAILEPYLIGKVALDPKKTVVIGTIKGDIHDIGKNLVGAMLKGGEFNVIDLGVDQSPENFVARAEEEKAAIIAVSCILTTSVKYIQELIDLLTRKGIRRNYRVIVGGAALSPSLAQEIGADGYAPSGDEVVGITKVLLK